MNRKQANLRAGADSIPVGGESKMKNIQILCAILFAISFGVPGFAAGHIKQIVYVAISGETRISVFNLAEATGELKLLGSVEVGKSPGSLAVSPDQKFLYAAIRGEKSAAALSIDPKTGELKLMNKVDIDGVATYVTTDRSGKYLLAAYYGDGKISSFAIGDDGKVKAEAVQTVETEKTAHSIQIDKSNRFSFVPHTGPNKVYQFIFDASTGKFKANSPATVSPPDGQGPRHYAHHPKLDVVYSINETGSGISAYTFDKDKGTLKVFQTLPTLPDDFKGRNSCADIHITPDGRFVYGSNRGHNSLAGYSIDQNTGKLTSIGRFETEAVPREFDIDTTGRYVYSAGQKTGKLAAFRINAGSGKLLRFATYDVGKGPAWVTVLRLGVARQQDSDSEGV
jgi:6-phosphogluconolactonase